MGLWSRAWHRLVLQDGANLIEYVLLVSLVAVVVLVAVAAFGTEVAGSLKDTADEVASL